MARLKTAGAEADGPATLFISEGEGTEH